MSIHSIRKTVASSHRDRHNTIITKGALEGLASSINGEYAVSIGVEHDPTFPPMGKVTDATLEPTDDGEWRVVATQELFDDPVEIALPDGTTAWMQWSPTDQRPFSVSNEDFDDGFVVSIDPANFATPEDYTVFLETLKGDAEFTYETYFRKSLLADPQLIISFGAIGLYLWSRIGKSAVEQASVPLSREIGNDLAKLYSLIKSAVAGMTKLAIPKNRPQTYIIRVPGSPIVDLIARTADADLLTSSLQAERIAPALEKAMSLKERLGATNVQFEMEATGEWRFNYLLTTTGAVIGRPAKFTERNQQLEMIVDNVLALQTAERNRTDRPT